MKKRKRVPPIDDTGLCKSNDNILLAIQTSSLNNTELILIDFLVLTTIDNQFWNVYFQIVRFIKPNRS